MSTKYQTGTLEDVDPRQLERRIVFDVFTDASNPHEYGPMTVTIDPRGLSCHWLGCARDRWEFDWAEIRHFCELVKREDYQKKFETGLVDQNDRLHQEIAVFRKLLSNLRERNRFDREAVQMIDAVLDAPTETPLGDA